MVVGMIAWAVVGGIGAVIMIIVTIGVVPGLCGLFVNIAFTFATGRLALRLKGVEKERTAASDKRMQTLGQLIEGIKAVKYYAWEEPSTEKVASLREEECLWISRYRRVQAITMQTGRASPPLAACAALVIYSLIVRSAERRGCFRYHHSLPGNASHRHHAADGLCCPRIVWECAPTCARLPRRGGEDNKTLPPHPSCSVMNILVICQDRLRTQQVVVLQVRSFGCFSRSYNTGPPGTRADRGE
eukprot:COSAG06_NODE_2956_length_6028_cov_7.551864_4_plen_244_part_00